MESGEYEIQGISYRPVSTQIATVQRWERQWENSPGIIYCLQVYDPET